MSAVLNQEYMTIAEAAELLRLHPSTIRRWIAQGVVTGYRVGPRHVLLKRAELDRLPVPIDRVPPEWAVKETSEASIDELKRRGLTPEEQARAMAAIARAKQRHQEQLARRGGVPFSPSWEIINQQRDQRIRELAGES
jgi:excisionase family DNA binding protein